MSFAFIINSTPKLREIRQNGGKVQKFTDIFLKQMNSKSGETLGKNWKHCHI